MYLLLLLIGIIGYVAMLAMGFAHTGGHGHSLNAHGHGHSLPIKGVSVNGSHSTSQSGHHHSESGLKPIRDLHPWFFLSPISLFSMSMGAGITGLMLTGHLAPLLIAFCAVGGAFGFQLLLVKPIMDAVLKFASRPSAGLEGMVAQPVEALTAFDRSGKGLVRLTLDGQIVQLLATLEMGELSNGVKVSRGDRLLVTGIDAARNSCKVTKELDS